MLWQHPALKHVLRHCRKNAGADIITIKWLGWLIEGNHAALAAALTMTMTPDGKHDDKHDDNYDHDSLEDELTQDEHKLYGLISRWL